MSKGDGYYLGDVTLSGISSPDLLPPSALLPEIAMLCILISDYNEI